MCSNSSYNFFKALSHNSMLSYQLGIWILVQKFLLNTKIDLLCSAHLETSHPIKQSAPLLLPPPPPFFPSSCLYIWIQLRGHSGAVVTNLPPTSKVDGSNPTPCVGKMVVSYTPFTLQVVSPTVSRIWWNIPVLGSLPHGRLQTCESVVNRSYYLAPPTEILKCLKLRTLNLVLWIFTEDFTHAYMNFLLW